MSRVLLFNLHDISFVIFFSGSACPISLETTRGLHFRHVGQRAHDEKQDHQGGPALKGRNAFIFFNCDLHQKRDVFRRWTRVVFYPAWRRDLSLVPLGSSGGSRCCHEENMCFLEWWSVSMEKWQRVSNPQMTWGEKKSPSWNYEHRLVRCWRMKVVFFFLNECGRVMAPRWLTVFCFFSAPKQVLLQRSRGISQCILWFLISPSTFSVFCCDAGVSLLICWFMFTS